MEVYNKNYQQVCQVKPKRVVDFFPDGGLKIIKPKNKSLLKAFKRLQKAGLIKPSGKEKVSIEFEPFDEITITPANLLRTLHERQIALIKENYYTDNRFVLIHGSDFQCVLNEFLVTSPVQMINHFDYEQGFPKLLGITLGFTREIQGCLLLPAQFIKDLARKMK